MKRGVNFKGVKLKRNVVSKYKNHLFNFEGFAPHPLFEKWVEELFGVWGEMGCL